MSMEVRSFLTDRMGGTSTCCMPFLACRSALIFAAAAAGMGLVSCYLSLRDVAHAYQLPQQGPVTASWPRKHLDFGYFYR